MPTPVLKLLHAATPDAADADLLVRFGAARDEAAFAELVKRHGPCVYRVCRRLAPRSADDAYQATFLVLACRATSVKKAASVGSWLVGVAGRVARQMARRERRTAGVSRLVGNPSEGAPHQPAYTGRSPDTAELAAILDDELTRLPDRYLAPVVLCLVNGRTQEQAAAELGGSVRTLRRRLDQAKSLLRLRLERRGVVPAVAAALVAGAGAASAVPPELQRAVVRGAFEFLNGGAATSPAAVVAKGVVSDMATTKTTALVATVAAVMIGLGVGAAQPPAPPPNVPLPMPGLPPANPPPRAAAVEGALEASSVHRSSNFLVTAPTAVIARAVAAEAEFQRELLGKLWLGESPATWSKRCEIRVAITGGASSGSTTFTFGFASTNNAGVAATKPACTSALMNLQGSFENVLTNALPHEVTHCVLAYHFAKAVPRWADEGVALLAESGDEQTRHDVLARKILNEGRGIRLKVLFALREYPRDAAVLYAQSHSVVRFLRIWAEQRFRNPPAKEAKALIVEFVQKGMDGNTAESWDKAANEVFGFADVDALEAQWLAWLATPKSQLGGPKTPGTPNTADPTLIPPTTLPGGGGGPPSPEAMFLNARKVKLPITRASRSGNVYLFVSRDKGAAWARQATLAAGEESFLFDAPDDGEYWFAVNTQDRLKLQDLTPAMKVVVDTTPPVVGVRPSGKGVEWAVTDVNLNTTSIKLQCKRPGWKEWQTIDDRPMKAADTYAWALKSGESIETRVIAKDLAGNETTSGVVKVE